jgi:purine-nucleoside phosphorylase
METLQYQAEVDNCIDNLVTKLQKACPDKAISRNAFKNVVLNFTSLEELNGYLVYATTQGVSIKDALICTDAFFELRWDKLILLVNDI